MEFLLESFQNEDFLSVFEQAKNAGEHLAKGQYPTGKFFVAITDKDIDRVQDALSVLLTQKGIDVNGELNETGLRIDVLIDQFS